MPNLKEIRTRITTVKSTQKITSAMKMVSAVKLRYSRDAVEAVRPFTEGMEKMMSDLLLYQGDLPSLPWLLTGNPDSRDHLLMVFTSDRGLCGGFNSNITREVKNRIASLEAEGKNVQLWCVGKRGRDYMKRDHGGRIFETITDMARCGLTYATAEELGNRLIQLIDEGKIGSISAIYSRFQSALVQQVTHRPLVPLLSFIIHQENPPPHPGYLHILEPTVESLFKHALPANLISQLLRILLETDASEHGARTTAMDNATRNAKEVIDRLQIYYNRTRQGMITKELIEIISGAESLK